MYKILVVDDDSMERDGIEYLIKSLNMQFEVVKAKNGMEAIKIVQNGCIDIMIIDIIMPGINGIDTIRDIRMRNSDLIIVIYSAYSKFEYAKQALAEGVTEYLLKPIKIDEFNQLCKKLYQLCEDKRKFLHIQSEVTELKELRMMLEMNRILKLKNISKCEEETVNKINTFLKQKPIVPFLLYSSENDIITVLNFFKEKLEKIYKSKIFEFLINSNSCLYFMETNKRMLRSYIDDFKIELAGTINELNQNNVLVVGQVCTNLKEVVKEYNKMLRITDYYFSDSVRLVVTSDEEYLNDKEDLSDSYFNSIKKEILKKNWEFTKSEIDNFFKFLMQNRMQSSLYIKHIAVEITRSLLEAENITGEVEEYAMSIYYANDLASIKMILWKLIDRIMSKDGNYKSDQSRLIKLSKRIISEEYSNYELSLGYIANKLNISNGYLSCLFKKQVGKNLVQYITDYRLEKASILLQNKSLKIKEVCKKVGYENQSYFTMLFSNAYGKTPLQFREEL